jgi:membrane-associated protease RseP (regulator of RpoE activity)
MESDDPSAAGDDPDADLPPGAPAQAEISTLFDVEAVRLEGETVLYLGEPRVGPETLEREVWPLFRDRGYEVEFTTVSESEEDPISGVELTTQRHALVARPSSVGVDGIPWLNVVTFLLTVLTTLYAGSIWYHEPFWPPLEMVTGRKWLFTAAVMSVLGVHELGHYVLSRFHRVDASLPYFIPMPNFIGTLGAVIRMKGRIPDRKALFDIGVAGPLAGLVMAVVVSLVGLYMEPITVPQRVLESQNAVEVEFGYPPLMLLLQELTGRPLSYPDPTKAVSPVLFGGWVGMFVTFLNLIPVGQLDGGHLVRAMLGKRQETVGAVVPMALFGLAAYLYVFEDVGGNVPFLWGFWGLLALALAKAGPAHPIHDEDLDRKRLAIGAVTFVLGALCFVPVPFEIIQ